MNALEAVRLAWQAIMKNRVRAGLTMLGIIIGVASVVALVSIGRGVEDFVLQEFNTLGANIITVTPQEPESETRDRVEPLTMDDVRALQSERIAPDVASAAAVYTVSAIVADEGAGISTTVRGVTQNYIDVQNWDIASGTWFNEAQQSARVAVIGADLPGELYDLPPDEMVGRTLTVNDQPFRVIGVMEPRESLLQTQNISVFTPIRVAQTILDNARVDNSLEVSQIYAEAADRSVTRDAQSQIDRYLYRTHNIQGVNEKDYDLSNQVDLLNTVNQITSTLTLFLAIIAGVSLVVGGVGVMNVMLASVTERTEEVGLRKAVGARPADVLLQFLVESVMLCLVGGVLGIALAWSIAAGVSYFVDALTLTVRWDAILLATAVSTIIGVTFGVLPANRAARMDPIDALRTE